jgi:hypothetical protein
MIGQKEGNGGVHMVLRTSEKIPRRAFYIRKILHHPLRGCVPWWDWMGKDTYTLSEDCIVVRQDRLVLYGFFNDRDIRYISSPTPNQHDHHQRSPNELT